ncbi:MAG: hypothetical protein SP1CHLAM54_10360 [Chlamydiia bacterium]|nr:hypothetical protein [Chlamydiia bacterium]MCH9615941.1 hypothetical protein [Chlamydiia bacterium]MCH9628656.1 hypothetical protein [Chlamydiia bacterium]
MGSLTNEQLKAAISQDNFELTNKAIDVVRSMIRSGKEVSVPDLLNKLKVNPKIALELPSEEPPKSESA